jgi:hypothetical protein
MNKFAKFLIEISLQDHYDKYVQGKSDLTVDQYMWLASFDPTTRETQRGKYVEWLLRMVTKGGYPDVRETGIFPSPDERYGVNGTFIKDKLQKFDTNSSGVSINQFKSMDDFFAYVRDLVPKESNKQLKKKEKDIFNMPDDIKVIDVTDEWICIETLTREGNIKGAQYKTSPQANWCTAYLDTDYHWKNYHDRGDLLQFINKENPKEKYQVFIEDGSIKESRDYDDRQSSEPFNIIKELPEFESNYGKVNEREPFKYIWDEEGGAAYLLDDNFDREWDYLNRQPDENEYDDYYEEASENEEFQINHWDRFLRTFFEIYKDNKDRRYSDVMNRIEYVPSYFKTPITGLDSDIEPATEAVIDFCDSIEEDWNDYLESTEYYDDNPKEEDYNDKEEFERDSLAYKRELLDDFKRDEGDRIDFIKYFLDDGFEYNFSFDSDDLLGGKDNSHEQTSFNFESILNKLRG